MMIMSNVSLYYDPGHGSKGFEVFKGPHRVPHDVFYTNTIRNTVRVVG